MTNADRIRQEVSRMTDEELSEPLSSYICKQVSLRECSRTASCYECGMKWLRQEVSRDDDKG